MKTIKELPGDLKIEKFTSKEISEHDDLLTGCIYLDNIIIMAHEKYETYICGDKSKKIDNNKILEIVDKEIYKEPYNYEAFIKDRKNTYSKLPSIFVLAYYGDVGNRVVIGFAELSVDESLLYTIIGTDGHKYVLSLAILKPYRGLNLATKLINKVREVYSNDLYLYVNVINESAFRKYLHLGFKEVGGIFFLNANEVKPSTDIKILNKEFDKDKYKDALNLQFNKILKTRPNIRNKLRDFIYLYTSKEILPLVYGINNGEDGYIVILSRNGFMGVRPMYIFVNLSYKYYTNKLKLLDIIQEATKIFLDRVDKKYTYKGVFICATLDTEVKLLNDLNITQFNKMLYSKN